MCAVRSLASFIPLGLRGFFAVVARRGVWRLPVFLLQPARLTPARADLYLRQFSFSLAQVFSG